MGLLDHDAAMGTLLLERLEGHRSLAGMADGRRRLDPNQAEIARQLLGRS